MSMTIDEYHHMSTEIRRITIIKSGSFPINTINGVKLTFIAANDDEAFSLGTELYGIIKRCYGIKERFSTWWNIEKFEANGFDNQYELAIGENL